MFYYTTSLTIFDWNMEKVLHRKGYGGTVLMDLSKTFDTINYDFLLAKLYAYGLNNK